jgi:crossover junction endodeoxyribonuclease RuvC
MRILGIDPGTNRIGYGFIEKRGGSLRLIDFGLLEIAEKSNKKFLELAEKIEKLIRTKKPDLAALEKLYFSKNRKTAIEVAQSRGILLFLLLKNKIPVIEYSPSEIKKQITGYGLNDKSAVARMVDKILKTNLNVVDDVTDAIAVAISASRIAWRCSKNPKMN